MGASDNSIKYETSTVTVLILFFCLLGLFALLFFLYKKLNKETDGEYTIRRMYYKEGGVRDRARGAALALGTRLGVQLWPDTNEEGEEMQEVQDEEGQLGEGGSQSDSEGDDQEEDDYNTEHCCLTKGKADNSSDANSSLEGSEEADEPEAKREAEEKSQVMVEKMGEGKGKGEVSGGAELLIDLNKFSGSAIWSEEGDKDGDVTAL